MPPDNKTVTTLFDTGNNPSLSHTPVGGDPRGALVIISQSVSSGAGITGVTYGGVAMTQVSGSPNTKATAETMIVSAWRLLSGIPTGTQTVAIAVTSSRSRSISVYTVTADGDMEVVDTDVTINSDSLANPSATLGLGGASSFCVMGLGSGSPVVSGITPLANWTDDIESDAGSQVSGVYSYDIIGTSDVTIGWAQSADDALAIGVAIKESSAPAGNPWNYYAQQ